MPRIRIANQRAIIDRRKLAEEIAALGETGAPRAEVVALAKAALDDGRGELAQRLLDKPSAGHEITAAHSFLIDQLIRLLHDYVTDYVYPSNNRSSGEHLALIAVGGYGRQEMCPHSDIDIAFITPSKQTAWCEQVIEALLYFLWDLGLKVGHSSRSLDDMVRMAKDDLTIRTTLLEGRYLWGERDLYEEASRRFWAEVARGTDRQFVTEKLAERDARHKRMGDSRYVVEPNVKEGKGGLRDLQTLYWIGKYLHRVRNAAELVDEGLLSRQEYRWFRRAEGFFLAVRSHLHTITGRAEDRLTFDLQREVAKRMQFADRPGKSAVERFMQYYFLQAKRVGSLTGVFLAKIDTEFAAKRARTGLLAGFRPKERSIKGYRVSGGHIGAPSDDWFRNDPVRLIELFQLAEEHELEVHPETMRMATRDVKLIDGAVRNDARANALFLKLLAGRNDPEMVLRWMNEAEVFGRFVPDFGKVNAQMQFDMYHHYTVDEHTIRAIGLTSQIERRELTEDHPLATATFPKLRRRELIYVAVLLHDIAKGRGGDHSELGAEVARELCPRFGLDQDETQIVAWLVEQHLLMSRTAQKRDLSDPKTVTDFVSEVKTLEKLRLLLILTVVDIRAVGPGTWNDWKRQLIGQLFELAEERLRLGHKSRGRADIVAGKQAAARELAGLGERFGELAELFNDSYWIAEPPDVAAQNLARFQQARDQEERLAIDTAFMEELGATLVTVIADDHPGLFFRIAGGIHLAGANIIDARIHTTSNGKAVDNFLVQDPLGKPFAEDRQLERLTRSIADAIGNKVALVQGLAKRPLPRTRAGHFDVRPRVTFDNAASGRFTVIEVAARDRPALLNRLAHTLFENQLVVHSAHVTHYGEVAADTFYVTDLIGHKVTARDRLARLENRLLEAASDELQREIESA